MDILERTCRNICMGHGVDPDARTIGGHGGAFLPKGPRGSMLFDERHVMPAWKLYASDARAALAAVEADESDGV